MIDLTALKTELTTDPLNLGYAAKLANGTGLIPELINRQNRDIVKDVWLTDRGMVSELVPVHGTTLTDSIFTKFDTVAASSKTVERMVNRLYNDERGLNFGDAGLRGMFASWSGNILTVDEANALLGLGISKGSRAEELFGEAVTEIDVKNALEL